VPKHRIHRNDFGALDVCHGDEQPIEGVFMRRRQALERQRMSQAHRQHAQPVGLLLNDDIGQR
jgi:hypothetical protein